MWKRLRPTLREPAPSPEACEDSLAELGRRAQAGDRRAMTELLSLLTPALLRVARQILGPLHAEVHDVTQEAACGLLSALPRFRGESTLLHFACRIAVLAAMNARRRELSRARKAQGLYQQEHVCPSRPPPETPEQALSSEHCVRAMRELLDSLPAAQAEVLGLHHVVGMTAGEIAGLTETPLETVRSRLKMGRRALRDRVLGDERLLEVVGASHGHARRLVD
jgi:RNA polymerase sigma-70 factor (ECF subfamily)